MRHSKDRRAPDSLASCALEDNDREKVYSERRKQPFIALDCTVVTESLFESEFFGHRKGSFPGATADREGRFQLAERGTLLLDEVAAGMRCRRGTEE